jgi:hypothetical protein
VRELDPTQPSTERRRSQRVSESLPLIVRGIDLLGQPFEEHTSVLAFNLQGCRYASKHHLPKNTWVTVEPQVSDRRNVRARVAWIQKPHSVRELFQIAVELERAANIWGFDPPPADWALAASSVESPEAETRITEESEAEPVPTTLATFMRNLMTDMTKAFPGSPSDPNSPPDSEVTSVESPLLRELRTELEQQATKTVEAATSLAREKVRRATEEIERKLSAADEILNRWQAEIAVAQTDAREQLSRELGARQAEFLAGLKSEFEDNFSRGRELMDEIERKVQALRAETETAQETASWMAQARLQVEAAEAVRAQKQPPEVSQDEIAAGESVIASWRQRLESEMGLAQAQWNELLQSSLDSGMRRLVQQLSERSQEILRSADQKISERFAELRHPFAEVTSEARETVNSIKSVLEQELARARSSLAEIEHSAERMRDYAAQLDAASHDTLNELRRRLEGILEAQTAEMNRRVEGLAAGLSQRVTPTLDSLELQFVERAVAEVESKLAPHLERVPGLLRELAAREGQIEESLRLHRERLRQISESNQREVASQVSATLAGLHNDFETARKEALAKWSEELDASGVRASHAAAESIARTSEWFQQEARARLQVLVEQTLTTAASRFEEETAVAGQKFEAHLESQSSSRLARIQQQLDGVSSEVVSRTRPQLEEAAEAAAASFGEVLRGISAQEVQVFTANSRNALRERSEELERVASQLLRGIESSSEASLARFQEQMASQLEARITEGRSALAAEFASAMDGFHTQRAEHEKEWAASLELLSSDAIGKHQERLETTCDSWMVSSVHRLNEHGQDVIESLMRSADQALRDSCSKVFDGLAEMLKARNTNAAGVAGFTPVPNRDAAEAPTPRNEAR